MFGLVEGSNIVGKDLFSSFGRLSGNKEVVYDEAVGESPLSFLNAVSNKPLGSLIIYGRTIGDTSVGDTGSIMATIYSKNMIGRNDEYIRDGSSIVFYGYGGAGHKGYKLRANVTYTFSFNPTFDDAQAHPSFIDHSTGSILASGEGSVLTYTPDKDVTATIMVSLNELYDLGQPTLAIGDSKSSLVYGLPGQIIDIPTQKGYGLKGEKVAAGGNYIDSSGQRWNCDEINFGEGKHIKRVGISGAPVESELDSGIMEEYRKLISNAGTNVITIFSGNVNSGVKVLYEGPLSIQ